MAAIAGVALPLIETFAPSIINLIVSLVHGAAPKAEAKFPVSGTGPVKFADVFGAVISALQDAAATGAIPKALPSDESIKAIIQAVVTSLNLSGALGATAVTPAAATAQTITLKTGQSITIMGGV